MESQPASAARSDQGREEKVHSTSAGQSDQRRTKRSLTEEKGPIEICAWSREISQDTARVHQKAIQDLSRNDIIQQFEKEKLAKHEAYYSTECDGQRRLGEASESKMTK